MGPQRANLWRESEAVTNLLTSWGPNFTPKGRKMFYGDFSLNKCDMHLFYETNKNKTNFQKAGHSWLRPVILDWENQVCKTHLSGKSWVWWHMPVIPAMVEAQNWRFTVQLA
jgi:hypothetical protein